MRLRIIQGIQQTFLISLWTLISRTIVGLCSVIKSFIQRTHQIFRLPVHSNTTTTVSTTNVDDPHPHQQQQHQQHHRFLKVNMSNNSSTTKSPTSNSGTRPQRSQTTANNQPNRPRPPIRMQSTQLASTSTSSGGGGSGLLLRLFQSEYFNVHLAIAYLKNYPESIGITYYLIDRLNKFPEKDIEFYWPQLCHLLISRPTESFALESFLIKKCHDSTHLAMKTLWYLQSSLSDLSSAPNTRSFAICRRTFNKVQSIIFSDPLLELLTHQRQEDPRITGIRTGMTNGANLIPKFKPDAPDPHPSKPATGYLRQIKKQALAELAKLKGGKISEKVLPTTVGLGLMLGGIALPQMTNQLGIVPIEQSRNYEDVLNIHQPRKNKKQIEPDNSASEEEIDRFTNSDKPAVPPVSTHISTKPKIKMNHQTMSAASARNIRGKGTSPIDYTPGAPLTHTPMTLSISSSSSSAATPLSVALSPDSQTNPLSPSRSSRSFSQEALELVPPLSKPSILTAPPSEGLFPGTSKLRSIEDVIHDELNFGPSRPNPPDEGRSTPAPSPIPHFSSRTRIPPASSQSVPSLPNALAKSKSDIPFGSNRHNFHHINRPNPDARNQNTLISSLAIDPSSIPSHVLDQVLKSQSMRSQLDLITNLQDISTRLVIVPKMARLSALRAELTVLNHSLPKGCCLGMYCKGEHVDGQEDEESESHAHPALPSPTMVGDTKQPSNRRAHHRIVRISPNESVVLNSADRAPFLIHVEVLEDHLDFDPERRSNYEDLRKALSNSALSNDSTLPSRRQQNLSVGNNGTFPVLQRQESHNDTLGSSQSTSSSKPLSRNSSTSGLSSDANQTLGRSKSPFDSSGSVNQLQGESQQRILLKSSDSKLMGRRSSLSPCLEVCSPIDKTLAINGSLSGEAPSIASSSKESIAAGSLLASRDLISEQEMQDLMEEEVDLVEQVYGDTEDGRLSSKAIYENGEQLLLSSLQSERNHLPSSLQNKALDEEAWRRVEAKRRESLGIGTSKLTISKQEETDLRNSPSIIVKSPTISLLNGIAGSTSQLFNSTALTKSSQKPIQNIEPASRSSTPRKPITLDEYAERMRMAAIMLAQLNASQIPSQQLSMTSSSAAGMVVGGAIGLGAGFVGVTVGAGLGAVVSRLATNSGQQVITSPIGRTKVLSKPDTSVVGQGGSGVTKRLDTTHAASGSQDAPKPNEIANATDANQPPTSNMNSGVPRHKVLTPLQSQAIKDKIMAEMMALEEERVERMKMDKGVGERKAFGFEDITDEAVVMKAVNEDDPSGRMLGESWEEKRNRIKLSSPYGHLSNWNVFSVIVKTGADLRQEQLITQLIKEFGRIWNEEKCDVWVRYYRILVTGESTGLMETIVDAVSLHSLKKAAYAKISQSGEALPSYTIYDHYLETYGQPHTSTFKKAQDKFMRSLVSYSIISYILQIKDRHNGNILIDKEGHVIHIDFGFVLSNSPGSLGFEMAPFKLSQDYIELLGGIHHQQEIGKNKWIEFVELFKIAFKSVRKHAERIITIVELMQSDSKLPCFGHGDSTVKMLRERFQLALTSDQCDEFVEKLILSSASSVFTKLYDSFQYYSQGVL
ncbi:uncharacterized protein MELLADRAFT_92333 [Melampsora larici-populina 98AG31]|uniref:1-phosphatidylinositol 4-kinase n=1 Tax=Melampsora larici-populina (strain 98AG31 / pathotype 3-4-7) TaxID=747676 RepID=F4R985_MELLP|nr:uncharacterized protein MELLADRAFT_92333 [Melampsora larici-populina 98AG31]EGG11197.1 hypothetical protein MELLADRAFT_92333 [Melampsora larici-populina 98AG31]